jgi:hypothetical protein
MNPTQESGNHSGLKPGSGFKNICQQQWYGVEIDESNNSPDVTRIASDMILHALLPIHSLIRGCLLRDNGLVNYFLKADDWTKKEDGSASNLDGTDGQVMIEYPDFWYQVHQVFPAISSKWQIKISQYFISGWTKVPKHYVSAYQTALNRSTTTLASVKNTSTTYRGGNNASANDANYNTLLGMPASNFNRTNGRTYARNRGIGWNLNTYGDHKWLYWLYVIEFATLNSQKAVNATLTAAGYKQGGLGSGVTTVDSTQWNNNFAYNPFVPCGSSDSLGNGSGEVSYTIAAWQPFALTVKVPRYRGIENPFGHIWNILDGVNIEAQSNASGGETRLWTTDNPRFYNDSNYANYIRRGNIPRADGYMSKAIMGEGAEILPSVAAGGSATYYCDYLYQAIPANGIDLRMLIVGGHAHLGTAAGFVCSVANNAPSIAAANLGSRLRFELAA